ncbi:hypothetical protein DFH29DRAFT_887567 [Suillus ampliporus]|nr:hypothetical protein DFH29DRAFT_887567 [Suillus ampliporus]
MFKAIDRPIVSQKIVPSRMCCAAFMTLLNAPGFSISVVNVSRIHELVNGDSSSISMVRES